MSQNQTQSTELTESSELVSVDDRIDAIAREALAKARRLEEAERCRHNSGAGRSRADYTCTPDRRYFVVRGRLWRLSNPALDEKTHQRLVNELLAARRAVQDGKDSIQRITARLRADAAKRALGERGPVWWTDGAPDYHRCLAVNTPYATWFKCKI